MGGTARREAVVARLLERALQRTSLLTARLQVLLGADLDMPRGEAASAELERLQAEVQDLGWALGRLGADLGADAMGPRHHPEGLALLVDLAEDELDITGPLPSLGPCAGQLELLLALILAGGGAFEAGPEHGGGAGWSFRGRGPGPAPELIHRIEATGLEPRSDPSGWVLAVPASWLQDEPPLH